MFNKISTNTLCDLAMVFSFIAAFLVTLNLTLSYVNSNKASQEETQIESVLYRTGDRTKIEQFTLDTMPDGWSCIYIDHFGRAGVNCFNTGK